MPDAQFGPPKATIEATIADSGTTSGEIDLDCFRLAAIYIPSGFEGTSLKFTVANEKAGTFLALYDSDGNEIDLTVAASQCVGVVGAAAAALAACRFVKLVAGSQTGASTLTLLLSQ